MATPKLPSQKSLYNKLNKRLSHYVTLVQNLYERYNLKAAQIALGAGYEGDGEFHFDDDAVSRRLIREVQQGFVDDMQSIIYSGITKEWRESNRIQDLIADKVLSFYDVTNKNGDKYRRYYQTDSGAYRAFNARRDRGLNLSKNLWSQADDYKTALEETISLGIQKGTSAITLSKKISQYLNDFDKIREDYTERFGKASRVKNCEYRSIRLARSEINMAYRTAEQERWKRMDFILGYEIKLSKAHKHEDICDCLAGKYPKDFKWTGWHPNDMCYAVPIIMSDEEFWGFDEDGNDVEATPNYVDDVPKGFKDWVKDNDVYIKGAAKRGTLPYFVRDNMHFVSSNDVKNAFVLPTNIVRALEEEAKSYGIKQVSYIGAYSEKQIKDVNDWIKWMTSEGLAPPDNIEISYRYFGRGSEDAVCMFVPSQNLICVNPDFDIDVVNDYIKRINPRLTSSNHKYHIYNHEYGHRQSFLHNSDIYYSFANTRLSPVEDVLARNFVSESCYNVHEFVAEVFAGLASGKKYNKDIMDMYIKYGGVVI